MNNKADTPTSNPRFKVTDRQLPFANVFKIMKEALPESAKISRESKETMSKCASEFIAFITCRAKSICENESRRVLTGEDMIRAMEDVDLPFYSEISKIILERYKESSDGLKMYRFVPDLTDPNEDFTNTRPE